MKKLLISSYNSIDGKNHSFEVSDEYVEAVNPIYVSYSDDIELILPTEDGKTIKINLNGFWSINPAMNISIIFPNKGLRNYYFSEKSYIEHIDSSKYWSEGAYYESNGVQAKNLSVNYQKSKGKCTCIQEIWSRYKKRLDGKPWPIGYKQKIPMETIEQFEAALTQLPRVKELIEYVREKFEHEIPGITDFLLLDKRFNRLNKLIGIEVSEEISNVVNDMLYLYKPTDIEDCDLLNSEFYSLDGKKL